MKRILLLGVCTALSICAGAKSFSVKSPSGNNVITLETGKELVWSVEHDGQQVLEPSALSMTLADGRVLGPESKARSGRITEVRSEIHPVLYRKNIIKDDYNCLTVKFRRRFSIELRAYDSGVAYRFVTRFRKGFKVAQEAVNFKFSADFDAFVPYANDPREGYRWSYSFESYYDECRLSEMIPDSLDKAGKAEIFDDGPNADLLGTEYTRTTAVLTPDDKMTVHLAVGGGWAAIIR